MSSALVYFGGSVFFLVILTALFTIEDSYGDRLLFASLRGWLDKKIEHFKSSITLPTNQGSFGYLRLLWHYFIHTFLKRMKYVLTRLNAWSDQALVRNREVAKKIKKARTHSHFEQISAHKEMVALSQEERAARKSH
jgi:hypothetical protein